MQPIQIQSDYQGTANEATKKDLKELFDYVAASYPDPEGLVITGAHGGVSIVAHNPRFALLLLKLTHTLVLDRNTWSAQHYDLNEVMVQVVNLYFKDDLSFQAHLAIAKKSGISTELQAALPYWRTAAHIFSDEQKLMIEYADAIVRGVVPDELFSKVVRKYGERAAIESASMVAVRALWAMIMNATGSHFDFGYGPPGTE